VIKVDEFITNKGCKAKLELKRGKFGPAYQVMIERGKGWESVTSVIVNKFYPIDLIIERVKAHY
jgi:hypothetical protein